jgi:hypothetical protein
MGVLAQFQKRRVIVKAKRLGKRCRVFHYPAVECILYSSNQEERLVVKLCSVTRNAFLH